MVLPSTARSRFGRVAARGSAVVAALAVVMLLAGCGRDDGIRISTSIETPSPMAAPATPEGDQEIAGTGEPVPLPDAPENPFAGGRVVESYIAGGDADLGGCLPEVVSRWRMAPTVDGPRCAAVDLDGDRRDEWVFVVSFGAGTGDETPFPADLWFFQDATEDYRFYHSARALSNATTSGLRIRLIEDLTDDGLDEVVLTWLECGAHTCVTHLTIASYHNGVLEDLAPRNASIESLAEFEVVDRQIQMTGGLAGSAGAGPQRESTAVVRWAGSSFRVEEEQGDPAYLVHAINDADRLFSDGDYAAARDAYLAAASDTALPDWRAEVGEPPAHAELQAYATFRAAVASYRLDEPERGADLLVRTIEQYPATMHNLAAQEYLVAVSNSGTPAEGCSAAEAIMDTLRSQYVAFWDYGYANPERSVFTLCR